MRLLVVMLWLVPAIAHGEPMEPETVTFEAGLGVGLDRFELYTGEDAPGLYVTTRPSVAASLGVGVWHTSRLALTLRVTAVNVRFAARGVMYPTSGLLYEATIGPAFQYWVDRHHWFGGGLNGMAYEAAGGSCHAPACSGGAFGPDLRFGYSFGEDRHAWNLSIDAGVGFDMQGFAMASLVVLAGYQLL